MEKPSDILKSLEERVTNPLLASFFFSFVILNWKIPVALFVYSPETIRKFGYVDHFYLIQSNIEITKPLYLSIGYTLAFPVIKYLLITWAKLVKIYSESLYLFLSKTSSIPFSKFLELEEKFNKSQEKTKQFLSSERKYYEEISNLKTEKLKLEERLNKELDRNQGLLNLNDKSYFIGTWEITNAIGVSHGDKPGNVFQITPNGDFHKIDPSDPTSKIRIGSFELISANPISYSFLISFVDKKDPATSVYCLVTRVGDGDLYRGTYLRNQSEPIEMRKIK